MIITLTLLCAFLPASIIVITACMVAGRADTIRQAEEHQFEQALRLQRLGHRTTKRPGYVVN